MLILGWFFKFAFLYVTTDQANPKRFLYSTIVYWWHWWLIYWMVRLVHWYNVLSWIWFWKKFLWLRHSWRAFLSRSRSYYWLICLFIRNLQEFIFLSLFYWSFFIWSSVVMVEETVRLWNWKWRWGLRLMYNILASSNMFITDLY